MSNTILTIDMITRKSLAILMNTLGPVRVIDRQYDSQFAQEGAKIGSSLRVRKPRRSLVSTGATLQVADHTDEQVTLTIANQIHIDSEFTDAELVLSLDDFSSRILDPDVSQLAAYMDNDVCSVYKQVWNSVGTPGTTPSTSLVLGQAMQKLDESATPRTMRYGAINPAANTQLVEGMKGLFHSGSVISKQFNSGVIGRGVLGFDELMMTQSINRHTTGAWGTTITVTSTVSTQGQATLGISFTGSSKTWKEGDVFTIANVYAVNPQTRVSTGSLQQFVVTADASGSSTATLSIAPAIYTSANKLATVDSFPQASAAVTMMGTASTSYSQNLVFHRNAFTLACADPIMPKGVHQASRVMAEGLAFRLVRQYDIINDRIPCRIGDVLYGYKALRPEMACRIWGE